jgi:hypothetical protein
LKSKFELNKIKTTSVIHQNFVQKVVSAILYGTGTFLVVKFLKKLLKSAFFH